MDVDDILGCILERMGSIVALLHAATTCKRWCRIVADKIARHDPNKIAAGDCSNHHPLPSFLWAGVEKGTSSHDDVDGPTLHSMSWIDRYRFSSNFLITSDVGCHQVWVIMGTRGSLMLINCRPWNRQMTLRFPDMVVCEPLTRRCKRIPPPPLDLDDDATCKFFGCYLADGDLDDEAGGHIGMSNSRIVRRLYRDGHSLAAVFSTSGSGGGMGSWTLTDKEHHVVPGPRADLVKNLGTAGGSWFFLNVQGRRLITFDGSTGEFSSTALSAIEGWDLQAQPNDTEEYLVTNSGDGKPRICTLIGGTMKVFATNPFETGAAIS